MPVLRQNRTILRLVPDRVINMGKFKQKFERREQKYLLNAAQYREVLAAVTELTTPDKYGRSRICNIYYDTPDWRVIRRSLDKPVYKEKLRLRTYGVPDGDSRAFVEIKKKYKGIVYKRRIDMKYNEAVAYLSGTAPAPAPCQISREIDWFVASYPGLRPAMLISYERIALYGREDGEFRVTFDTDIMWRTTALDLTRGVEGRQLLPEGYCLMEVKMQGAMPLWMAEILDRFRVYPVSYSKYGEAYLEMTGAAARVPETAGAENNHKGDLIA